MTMIKRGHSDTGRPSIVSSVCRCTECGHTDSGSATCPKCQGRMTRECSEEKPDTSGDCPNGICRID